MSTDTSAFPKLTIEFNPPLPEDLTGRVLVAAKLALPHNKTSRGEFTLGPQVWRDYSRSGRLAYKSLVPRDVSTLKPDSIVLTIVDLDDGSTIERTVVDVQAGARRTGATPTVTDSFSLVLNRQLPAGRSLSVKVEGIDSMPARAKLSTESRPKSSEEAAIVIGGTAIRTGGSSDQASTWVFGTELKFSREWYAGNWDVAPTLEANIGSEGIGYSDTVQARLALRLWLRGTLKEKGREPSFVERQSLYVAPVFTSDKRRDNQQLGLEAAWESVITGLYQPVERRQLNATLDVPRLGYIIKGKPVFEAGKQTRSEQQALKNAAYARIGLRLDAIFEYDDFSLVVAYALRTLLREEVTIEDSAALRTGKGVRQMLNVELGRNFGPFKLAATYVVGAEPPAFKRADALTINLKALF